MFSNPFAPMMASMGVANPLMGAGNMLAQKQLVENSKQQTRSARRLYVGNLPTNMGLDEKLLLEFLNASLATLGINTPYPCISAPLNPTLKYTFIEFRSVLDCLQCFTLLQGITLGSNELKISQPKEYALPEPRLQDFTVPFDNELQAHVNTMGLSAPLDFEALSASLALTAPDDSAAAALPPPPPCDATADATATDTAFVLVNDEKAAVPVAAAAAATTTDATAQTKIVVCLNMITSEDLIDDDDYEDIILDVQEECGKCGKLIKVTIPRPNGSNQVGGLGKIFLQYEAVEGAEKAKTMLHGRVFNGKSVVSTFYDEVAFHGGDYSK